MEPRALPQQRGQLLRGQRLLQQDRWDLTPRPVSLSGMTPAVLLGLRLAALVTQSNTLLSQAAAEADVMAVAGEQVGI